MRLFSRLKDPCFCAFCRSPRKVIGKKHIGPTNVLGAIMLSTGISFVLWSEPDPRALMILTLFLMICEFFVYWRWRANLVCRFCGFDPIVYKRSPAEAAQMVRQFFDTRVGTPEFQMSRSPLVDLYRRMQESDKQKELRRILLEKKKFRQESRSLIERPSDSMIDPPQA